MEQILSSQCYLAGTTYPSDPSSFYVPCLYLGDRLTEADIRAYTTAARFDVAYHGAFKCNLRTLRSYPNVNRWLKGIYWSEVFGEFRETTIFEAVSISFPLIFPFVTLEESVWKTVLEIVYLRRESLIC